jgi:hypothetical protein
MGGATPRFIVIWILTVPPIIIGILVLVTPNTKTTECVKYTSTFKCTITCVPINKSVPVDCHWIDSTDGIYYNYFNPSNYALTQLAPLIMGMIIIPVAIALNLFASLIVCAFNQDQDEDDDATPTQPASPQNHTNIPMFYTRECSNDNIELGIPSSTSRNVIVVINPKN